MPEDYMSRRKALKRATAKLLRVPNSELEWRNGELYSLTLKKPVEGVEKIPKPAKPVKEKNWWVRSRK